MLEEAIRYFKGEPGFNRLFFKWTKNYMEKGRITKSVKIGELTSIEKEILPSFFGRHYRATQAGIFTVDMFEKALNQDGSKFAGLAFDELLMAYNGGSIVTNLQKEQRREEQKNAFFEAVFTAWTNRDSQKIKQYILQKELGSTVFHKWYEENSTSLREQLETVFRAIDCLPQEGNSHYLPIFATRVTGNPHAFDLNTSLGKVFLSVLTLMNDEKCGKRSNEELTALLEHYGILRDDLLNNVICSGLLAYDPSTQKPLLSWMGSYEERVPKIATLRELVRPIEVRPPNSRKAVFIVENSGVFSSLLDRFTHEELPSMICSAGPFRLAALLLIDALVAQGETILYYSGDIDPEGLLIAQRLYERHPKQVILWRFGSEDYARCLSNEVVEESRIGKLKGISATDLQGVAAALSFKGLAGYQEKLIDLLEQDIRSMYV